jgi:hypothetical protein
MTPGILLAIALVVADVGVPIALCVWLAPGRMPFAGKWLVVATVYVAYAVAISRLVPVPSTLVLAYGASAVEIAFPGLGASQPIGLARFVAEAWLALAAIPACFFLLFSTAATAVRRLLPSAGGRRRSRS